MTGTRLAAAAALCAAVIALSGTGATAQPPAPTPVVLPPALKTPLMKRVTIEKPMEGTAQELIQKLADEYKFKIDTDAAVLAASGFGKQKVTLPAQKDVRLDVLLNDLLVQNRAPNSCVVKKDTLVIVDYEKAMTKLPGSKVGVQTLLQAPDATHTAATNAVKKKLATKVDTEALADVPLAEFLAMLSKRHGLTIEINDKAFRELGETDILDRKVAVKAAKGTTVEAVLLDAVKALDAKVTVDPYSGRVFISPKKQPPGMG